MTNIDTRLQHLLPKSLLNKLSDAGISTFPGKDCSCVNCIAGRGLADFLENNLQKND